MAKHCIRLITLTPLYEMKKASTNPGKCTVDISYIDDIIPGIITYISLKYRMWMHQLIVILKRKRIFIALSKLEN